MMGVFDAYRPKKEKPKTETPENKEPIKPTLDLTWLINDIDKSIQEIESSDIDLIDPERAARYISMLKYQKKQWIDNVLNDKSYNLVKKTIIIKDVVDIQMDFTKYLINMAKDKVRKIKGEQLIQVFKTLLDKNHIEEDDFQLTISKMLELEEHYRSNMSFYDDISDEITAIIYEKFKRFSKKYDHILGPFYTQDLKHLNIIKKEILKEAKKISLSQYEDNNKTEYQNEIRMFLTLKNLSNPKNIYELYDLILHFHNDNTPEIDTTIIKDNQTYLNLLKNIDSIKNKAHSFYTFLIIQLYYIKEESIDDNAFYNEVNEISDIFNSYITSSSTERDSLFSAIERITEHQAKSSTPIKISGNSIELKEKHYEYVKRYNDYLSYYSKMINDEVSSFDSYRMHKENILMLANFITSDMIGHSLDDDINHNKVKKEILKLLNCDSDDITLWKLNSYIRLYLGKPPSYIKIYEFNKDKYSVQGRDLNISEYDNVNKMVSNFFSELILVEPFYSEEKFENFFKEKRSKLETELNSKYKIDFNLSLYEYNRIGLNYKSIESPLKSPVNLRR